MTVNIFHEFIGMKICLTTNCRPNQVCLQNAVVPFSNANTDLSAKYFSAEWRFLLTDILLIGPIRFFSQIKISTNSAVCFFQPKDFLPDDQNAFAEWGAGKPVAAVRAREDHSRSRPTHPMDHTGNQTCSEVYSPPAFELPFGKWDGLSATPFGDHPPDNRVAQP